MNLKIRHTQSLLFTQQMQKINQYFQQQQQSMVFMNISNFSGGSGESNQTEIPITNLNLNTLPVPTSEQLLGPGCYNPPLNLPIIFLFNNPVSIVTDQIGNIYIANENDIVKTTLYGNQFQMLTSGFTNTITNIAVNPQGTYLYIANISNLYRINTDGTNQILLYDQFDNLYGITVDTNGTVYATTMNSICIMDPDGNIQSTIYDPSFISLFDIGVSSQYIYVVSNYQTTLNFYNQILQIDKQYPYSITRTVQSNLANILGLSVTANDFLYISDTSNNNVIKIDAFGNLLQSYNDLSLNQPSGLTTDLNYNIYIADTNNNQIKKVNNNDTQYQPFTYQFSSPSGIAIDTAGNLYIADQEQSLLVAVNTLTGTQSFIPFLYPFNNANGLAIDNINQIIYVADTNNGIVQQQNINGENPVILGQGVFELPNSATVDPNGILYVTDMSFVYKVIPPTIFLISGSFPFQNPVGIAADSVYVYVADTAQTQIVKMTHTGANPTLIGYGFNQPGAICIDKYGYLFVADSLNNRIVKMDTYGNGMSYIQQGIQYPYSLIADNLSNYIYVITVNSILKLQFSESIPCSNPEQYMNDAITQFCYQKGCEAILYKKLVTAANNPQITQKQQYATDIRTFKKIPVSYQTLLASLNCNRPPVNTPLVYLFNNPQSITCDQVGNLYVSNLKQIIRMKYDGSNKKIIATGFENNLKNLAVNYNGTYLYVTSITYLIRMNTDGTNRLNLPPVFNLLYDVAVDQAGYVYVTDTNTIKIMDQNGENLVFVQNSQFFSLYAISVFNGDLFVISSYIDSANGVTTFYNQLLDIDMSRFSSYDSVKDLITGVITITVPDSGIRTVINQLSNMMGLYVYNKNLIYLSNPLQEQYVYNSSSQSFELNPLTNTVFKINGNGNILHNYNQDVSFNAPYDVTVDPKGNVYVTDSNFNQIIKIPTTTKDMVQITYQFKEPTAVAVDNQQNLYIIDLDLSNLCVFYADQTQAFIGSNLNNPGGIAIDNNNQYIYIANTNNKYVLRMNLNGSNPVILGNGYFVSPYGIAVDSKGAIYVTDTTQIKKINPNQTLTIFPYVFNYAIGIAVDTNGYIYVADINNTSIVKLDQNGMNATYIGYGFSNPYDVAVDALGYVYVADSQNSRIVRMDSYGNGLISFNEGVLIPYSVAVDNAQNVYTVTSDRIIKFRFGVQAVCA